MADFRVVQAQNGGGLPGSREELNHILTQIYHFQTGRQIPEVFFQAVVDGLIRDTQRGGHGDLSSQEIQNLVANFTTSFTTDFAAESPKASPDKLSQIRILMSQFAHGKPLESSEQAAYNQRLAQVLPGFKALFSSDGHFQAFEEFDFVRTVTTEVETLDKKVTKTETNTHDNKGEDFLEYQLGKSQDQGLIFSVNQGIPSNIASWEDVFGKNAHQTSYPTSQQPETQEGLLSQRNYEPPKTFIEPTTQIPYQLGLSIEALNVPPPPIDQYKFTSTPSIVRAHFDRQIQSTPVYTPASIDVSSIHTDCIVLNEDQAREYFNWKNSHIKDPFDQFMDYIRHSPFNAANLQGSRPSSLNVTPLKTAVPEVLRSSNQNISPPVYPISSLSITGTTSYPQGTSTQLPPSLPIIHQENNSLKPLTTYGNYPSISGPRPGDVIIGGQPTTSPVLSTPIRTGTTSIHSTPGPQATYITSNLQQTPIPSIGNPTTIQSLSRPIQGVVGGNIQNQYPGTSTHLTYSTSPAIGPAVLSPPLPVVSSAHSTVLQTSTPLPLPVLSQPVTVQASTYQTGDRSLGNTIVTINKDWKNEIKVVEERSNGLSPLPIINSKAVTEHQTSYETRIVGTAPRGSSNGVNQPPLYR